MFDITELLNCSSKVLIQGAEPEGGRKDERKAPGVQRNLYLELVSQQWLSHRGGDGKLGRVFCTKLSFPGVEPHHLSRAFGV